MFSIADVRNETINYNGETAKQITIPLSIIDFNKDSEKTIQLFTKNQIAPWQKTTNANPSGLNSWVTTIQGLNIFSQDLISCTKTTTLPYQYGVGDSTQNIASKFHVPSTSELGVRSDMFNRTAYAGFTTSESRISTKNENLSNSDAFPDWSNVSIAGYMTRTRSQRNINDTWWIDNGGIARDSYSQDDGYLCIAVVFSIG